MWDALYFVLYDMRDVKQPSLLRVGFFGIMRRERECERERERERERESERERREREISLLY